MTYDIWLSPLQADGNSCSHAHQDKNHYQPMFLRDREMWSYLRSVNKNFLQCHKWVSLNAGLEITKLLCCLPLQMILISKTIREEGKTVTCIQRTAFVFQVYSPGPERCINPQIHLQSTLTGVFKCHGYSQIHLWMHMGITPLELPTAAHNIEQS